MKTNKQQFWDTNINPITGYEVPSASNYNDRIQKLQDKRQIKQWDNQ